MKGSHATLNKSSWGFNLFTIGRCSDDTLLALGEEGCVVDDDVQVSLSASMRRVYRLTWYTGTRSGRWR